MSKMFLTMEEAAEQIGKSVDDVKKMISEGKLQEFKQNDEIMIKSDQLALVIEGGEMNLDDSVTGDAMSLEDSFSDMIELDDASSSGSAIGLADSNEATGISAFDTALAQEPPAAAAAAAGDDEFNLDSLESGSQMLDLTRESDDSMVGAELMTQSFEDEEMLDLPSSASGIFNRMDEDGGAQSVAAALGNSPMSVPMVIEEYDGASSGMALGGMIAAALAFIIVAIMATGGTGIASWFNSTMGLGIPLILLIVLLGAGFVVGRATD
jgi:hypothetical protein